MNCRIQPITKSAVGTGQRPLRKEAAEPAQPEITGRRRDGRSPVLEELDRAFVLLSSRPRGERAKIAAPSCLLVLLARIQPVVSAWELANHGLSVTLATAHRCPFSST